MSTPRIAFLPLGRVNFDMECAKDYLGKSHALLRRLHPEILMPEGHLTEYDALTDWLRAQLPVDAVIIQASTFIDPRFTFEIARLTKSPALVWGVREPSADGGRLRLNSMTGVYSITNVLRQEHIPFTMIVGNPDEAALETKLARWMRAANAYCRLKTMRLGVIGSIPPGFFFSLEEETMLRRELGPTVVQMEIHKLFKQAEAVTPDSRKGVLDALRPKLQGLDDLTEARASNFAALYTALDNFVTQNKLDALCSRCWPDTFEALDIAPCAALSLLADRMPVACEADMGGTITNALLSWLSDGKATYFSDPVQVEEDADTITFWHCGIGAPSLVAPGKPVTMGVHPNRKVGPTMEFAVKPGTVTMCRMGKMDGKYRMLIAGGEALDEARRFQGTSAVVRPHMGAEAFAQALAVQGWEYHISFVHADVREELKLLAGMLGIEAVVL